MKEMVYTMTIKLAVMFGGASVEHEISILSAMQAMEHLDKEKYEILPIYIAKDKKMYHDECLKNLQVYKDLEGLCQRLVPITIFAKKQTFWIRSTSRFFAKEKQVDMVLPIMHGTNGEDGTVQGYLRMLGIPFCGSDVLGAAIGQDKVIMKQVLMAHKIPIVPWFSLHKEDMKTYPYMEEIEQLGFPIIIKPANLGSSVGIQIVKTQEDIVPALQAAFLYDEYVVVEKVIGKLREFNCSVLGNVQNAQTSSVEEVLKEDEILSYEDKYEKGTKRNGMAATRRVLPAPLGEEQRQTIERLALRTFQALRACGVVRIDFMMDEENGNIFVNEINTIPGSLSFYLWDPIGIPFQELLDYVIALALQKERQKDTMVFTYDTNILSSYHGGSKKLK